MSIWRMEYDDADPRVRFGAAEIERAYGEETGRGSGKGTEKADGFIRIGIDACLPEGAYRLRVCAPENGVQNVSITGADGTAAMYGCMDFVNVYLAQSRQSRTSMAPYFYRRLFTEEPLPACDTVSVPKVKRRGLWTWGMKVYDYRGYLENMARLKLNEVIFWNDYAPVNGREIVEYAHSLGIRVLWGYAWGWDTTMRLDDSDNAAERIAERYEREYVSLGGDGIYFQSFTETREETLGGKLIAAAVVDFINRVTARILQKYPGLRLQFGLHATSVRAHMEHIAEIDPRVEIIWEDCGDFPYAYIPGAATEPEETAAFTRRMLGLRENGRTGAVLKGLICLDWEKFVHQTGPEVTGCADEETILARLPEARRVWKFIQAEWMAHGDLCRRTVEQLAEKDVSLYGLMEDGMFEREIPLAGALFAAILWDPERPFGELLKETAQRPDVRMV